LISNNITVFQVSHPLNLSKKEQFRAGYLQYYEYTRKQNKEGRPPSQTVGTRCTDIKYMYHNFKNIQDVVIDPEYSR